MSMCGLSVVLVWCLCVVSVVVSVWCQCGGFSVWCLWWCQCGFVSGGVSVVSVRCRQRWKIQ